MASSTSSTGNILGANGTSNYMPGLASGLDTEDMVEKLLSGTQAKIDKQNAKKQQIEWKQDIYRDLITKINGFSDKYFSFFGKGDTNLLSSGFYNIMRTSSTNSAVKVTSATSRAPINMVIDSISQLATASKAESAGEVTGSLQGNIAADGFAADKTYSFDMSLDGVRKTIKFEGADNQSDLIDHVNASIKKVFGNTVQFDQNMKLAFRTSGAASSPSADTSHRVLLYHSADTSKNSADTSNQVVTEGVLGKLGFKNGASNKLDYSSYLSDIPFAKGLQGKNFTFSINGTEIKASSGDTLGDVINRINNSEAGVKVTYSSVKDKFLIESTNPGANINIEIEQTEGNLLTAMFGIAGGRGAGGSVSGLRNPESITGDTIDPDNFKSVMDNTGTRSTPFSLNVNGKDYTVDIPQKEGGYQNAGELTDALNTVLKNKFGTNDLGQNNVQVNAGTDQFEVVSNVGYKVSFSEKNVGNSIAGQMGFKKDSVQNDIDIANPEATLKKLFEGKSIGSAAVDVKITDPASGLTSTTTIDINEDTKLSDLLDSIKNALGSGAEVKFDSKTGDLSILSGTGNPASISAQGDGNDVLKALFGKEQIELGQGGSALAVEQGQNAILEVDGTRIERNTNTFDLDGITMELTAVTNAGDPPISLTTARDTDKIVEGLKSFVEDYNTLIEELNDQVNAEASFQKYAPLTDAQKKEMSEREIEKWEEKAKEGLLRNDSNISKFLQDMRTVIYRTVDSAGLALYDIGIEASGNYKDNGKLVLDESKLQGALTTRLDDIQKLFTDKDNGLAVQLQNALKQAANPSSGSPGSLVRYAGTKDVLVTGNTLYYEMKSIKETLTRLNTKYETERTRYWKQFTEMEKAISKMNSQSSWLTQQFS